MNTFQPTISKEDKILITGGFGFLGNHVKNVFKSYGYRKITRLRSKFCNLVSQTQTNTYLRRHRPNIIIHLAGNVGGIGANQKNPGLFFYENMQMGMNVLEYARKFDVQKVVMIGTVCSYPRFTQVPFVEEDLWNGYPEPTNAPYGIAKRSLIEMGKAYEQQYKMNVINLVPVNLYGPGDTFDPKRSHVIPALILKFWNAQRRSLATIDIWGTGLASREFLYVKDAAEGIALATEYYNQADPINLGTGKEVKIRQLVELIASEMKFMGVLRFDATKPDGQLRRCLTIDKAEELFGFKAKTELKDGLKKTIQWFKRHADEITRSFGM